MSLDFDPTRNRRPIVEKVLRVTSGRDLLQASAIRNIYEVLNGVLMQLSTDRTGGKQPFLVMRFRSLNNEGGRVRVEAAAIIRWRRILVTAGMF